MSRTDKDRPYWVRCEDPTQLRYESHLHGPWRGEWLECDLEDSAKFRFNGGPRYNRCGYWLVHRPCDSPPKDYVDQVWNSVERRRQRDELSEIRKLANTTMELDDVDFPNWQHRHCAQWLWY